MKTGTIARIGAAGFVVTALALSFVQLNEAPEPKTETVFVPTDEADPLRAELRRCRSIGQAAASDTLCLRAWAEQRSRFFMDAEAATGLEFGDPETQASAAVEGGAAAISDAAALPNLPAQDGGH